MSNVGAAVREIYHYFVVLGSDVAIEEQRVRERVSPIVPALQWKDWKDCSGKTPKGAEVCGRVSRLAGELEPVFVCDSRCFWLVK